jgi:tRNA threonylcarbamoyladenosine biosynthesis protein TsaB
MRLLAWDTSSKSGAIVALEWDPNTCKSIQDVRLVAELTLNVDATHSERLLWGIHQVLESARLKLSDIDVFGVGVGPGSFTGLRIGITTARTLAHTLQKPLIGVSSLAALARPVALHYAQSSTLVVAATDACKGELFAVWGEASLVKDCVVVPEAGISGLWKSEVEEQVIRPEELIHLIQNKMKSQSGQMSWIAVGEGRHRYHSVWNHLDPAFKVSDPIPFLDHVQGRYLGHLAWEAFQKNVIRDSLEVHPRYLRASDAELKLKAGLLAPSPVRG